MLGALSRRRNWAWTAHGKHPAARDYFTLGEEGPLAKAFIDWVDRGVQALPDQRELLSSPCSWRFWSRSPEHEHLACGLVKNSFDGMKRYFPLLVMGTGKVQGWHRHWDLTPLFYEESWERIERVTAQKFSDLTRFKAALDQLPTPGKNWNELETLAGSSIAEAGCGPGDELREAVAKLDGTGHVRFPLATPPGRDLNLTAMFLHRGLKEFLPSPPSAVFMGGFIDQSYLVLFTRPLGSEDFARLWNPSM